MIGRAAQGRPWLFREIGHFLASGEQPPAPEVAEIHDVLLAHLDDLYRFYGELAGMRMARKHIAWYTRGLADSASFRHAMNQLDSTRAQLDAVNDFFWRTRERTSRLIYLDAAPERREAA
jgi:tRNA-dihydrouridine synthase B